MFDGNQFQLTRPVWGEPSTAIRTLLTLSISTHSPRVGRTPEYRQGLIRRLLFQLTRPVWGEPSTPSTESITPTISTHSPRVGRTKNSL